MKFTILRVSLATALLVVAATSMQPHLTSYVSTSAVVNAPLVGVSAPFNGTLVKASPLVARPVEAGQTLFVLKNSEGQGASAEALRAEIGATTGQIVGLKKQMSDLQALSERLIARREAKIEARRAWFAPRLEEAHWEVRRAEALLSQAEEDHSRLQSLSEKGSAKKSDLIRAKADMEVATADVAQRRAAQARLEIEESTLDGELGVDLTSSDFEQIEYRIDEVAIRLADLDARLLGLETRRASLKTQEASYARESTRRESFRPVAPLSGLIWNASGVEGSAVSEGEQVVQILKCSRRFLEVILPARHFEKVRAGTEAWVKLKGSDTPMTAKVVASYGSGAKPNRGMDAAAPRIEATDGVRVIVVLDEQADLSSFTVQRAFCDVGRAAEVRFQMEESLVENVIEKIAGWITPATEGESQIVAEADLVGQE